MTECFFCQNSGGEIIFNCELYRIILVADDYYPGYLRIVLNRHLKELTDLSDEENLTIYQALIRAEKILRKLLTPDKINLASFGNLTPHVHWHLIPRFKDDRHFPNPTWGDVTNLAYQPAATLIAASTQLAAQFLV